MWKKKINIDILNFPPSPFSNVMKIKKDGIQNKICCYVPYFYMYLVLGQLQILSSMQIQNILKSRLKSHSCVKRLINLLLACNGGFTLYKLSR